MTLLKHGDFLYDKNLSAEGENRIANLIIKGKMAGYENMIFCGFNEDKRYDLLLFREYTSTSKFSNIRTPEYLKIIEGKVYYNGNTPLHRLLKRPTTLHELKYKFQNIYKEVQQENQLFYEADIPEKYSSLDSIYGNFVTVEIKEDFRCKDTKNVAVEFEAYGKPSGIETTEADYHIFRVHESDKIIRHYNVDTETLKEAIENKMYHTIKQTNNNDSNSMSYLFRLQTMKQFCNMVYEELK